MKTENVGLCRILPLVEWRDISCFQHLWFPVNRIDTYISRDNRTEEDCHLRNTPLLHAWLMNKQWDHDDLPHWHSSAFIWLAHMQANIALPYSDYPNAVKLDSPSLARNPLQASQTLHRQVLIWQDNSTQFPSPTIYTLHSTSQGLLLLTKYLCFQPWSQCCRLHQG